MKIFPKVLFVLLLLPLALALSSCGDNSVLSEVASSLEGYKAVTAETYGFRFTLSEGTDGETYTLLSPETVEGLSVVNTAEGVIFSFDGYTVGSERLAAERLIILKDALDLIRSSLVSDGIVKESNKDEIICAVAAGGIAAEITVGNGGIIKALTVTGSHMHIKENEYTIISIEEIPKNEEQQNNSGN